jgi:hypothetical protein
MSTVTEPPPALDCAQVIEYATVDDTVRFEQRYTLNVGGVWLGEVPHLGICQNLDQCDFMVFHCDGDWNVLGVAAGYNSVAEAKAATERSYHGIAPRWMPSGYSRDEASQFVAEQFKGQECSFCGRLPVQCHSVIGDAVRICNFCVDEFYAIVHSERKEI